MLRQDFEMRSLPACWWKDSVCWKDVDHIPVAWMVGKRYSDRKAALPVRMPGEVGNSGATASASCTYRIRAVIELTVVSE